MWKVIPMYLSDYNYINVLVSSRGVLHLGTRCIHAIKCSDFLNSYCICSNTASWGTFHSLFSSSWGMSSVSVSLTMAWEVGTGVHGPCNITWSCINIAQVVDYLSLLFFYCHVTTQLCWFFSCMTSSHSMRTVPPSSFIPLSCSATSSPFWGPSSQTAALESIGMHTRVL